MVVSAFNRPVRSASLTTSPAQRLPAAGRRGPSKHSPAWRRRPFFELLESRTLLSATLFVTAGTPQDATHFLTLQAALAAAASGDTIQLQSGFSLGTFISTSLAQNASAGSTSVHTTAALAVGDVISLNGGTSERALVTAVAQSGANDYLVSLASPLLLAHSASAAVHAADATIGLAQGVTLTADAGVTLSFDLEIWNSPASSSITLASLNLGTHSLFVDGGGATISACTLAQVVVQSGAHATSFLNNIFNPSGDGLSLDQADNTLLSGNTFNITADSSTGIAIHNSSNVLVLNNAITTGSGGTGIFVSVDDSQSATVDIRGNAVTTTDGYGVLLAKLSSDSALQVRLQGNDLRFNAADVLIVGDGASAGNIDLGGGSTVFGTGSGGNDFSGQTELTVDASHFTIGLFSVVPSFTLSAVGNTFSSANPLNLVADSLHIPQAGGSGIILAAPTTTRSLTVTGADLSLVQSAAVTRVVASFSDNRLATTPADYTASVVWSDGLTTPGTISANADGSFSVSTTRDFLDVGNLSATVTVSTLAHDASASAPVTAAVAPRTIILDALDFTSVKKTVFTGVVATFSDNLPGTSPGAYVVTIKWSDGNKSSAVISQNSDGSFSVATSRAFCSAGIRVAKITVATTDGLFSGSVTVTAIITNKNGRLPPHRIPYIFRLIKIHHKYGCAHH